MTNAKNNSVKPLLIEHTLIWL